MSGNATHRDLSAKYKIPHNRIENYAAGLQRGHNYLIALLTQRKMNMHATKGLHSALFAVCFLLFPVCGAAQVRQPGDSHREPLVLGVKAADPFDVETGIYWTSRFESLFL